MGNPMLKPLDPFRFLLIAVAGWMNQRQLQVIDYLREENRVLREQFGGRRLRLSDDRAGRLAAKAKLLGRRLLPEVATIVTPETLLAWHRELIAYGPKTQIVCSLTQGRLDYEVLDSVTE